MVMVSGHRADDHRPSTPVAPPASVEVVLDGHRIAADAPALVIAEIGINHNGSLALAKELVDAAADAGADCAKFQMRDLAVLYRNEGRADDLREDLGSQYVLDLLSRFSLTTDELYEAFDHCRSRGLVPLCTPWDLSSVRALRRYGMPGYKVASADLTNHELLYALATTGMPLIVSTGMSTEAEIVQSVALLREAGAPFVLLHCNSTYPAPTKDVNLRYLGRLAEISGGVVGYSGHERGIHVATAAVALGAKVIEKHLTLDRGMEGNDHKVSLLPHELAELVRAIRQVEEALGSSAPRTLSQGERMNRVTLAKSVVITRDARAGDVIELDMLRVKSPGQGLQPNRMPELVGRRLTRDMAAGDVFFPSDLDHREADPRPYRFRRSWGLPVRYHDHLTLPVGTNPDFLEFHLSYKDLETPLDRVFTASSPFGLVVHSPDLFAGDHILDLANPDDDYRWRSVKELQAVIDLTRQMVQWFPSADRPRVVVSMGGFTKDAPLGAAERAERYDRVLDSLQHLERESVELMAQTLPPFPWYVGGQLFCNLFVDPEDTAAFADAADVSVCFDVAHSQLAANHRGRPLMDWIDILGARITHLHVVDAAGVDGEGLQVGEGDVDFPAVARALDRTAPTATFIPEIWQGHVNGGEGFWVALDRLEQWF